MILARRTGRLDAQSDTGSLGVLTYLLESGSDRVGALDFQASADTYIPRESDHPSLELMHDAADRLAAGEVLPAALAEALLRGTSLGGARPKVTLLDEAARPVIAKLSTQTDTYPLVRYEAVAMELARRVGIDTARTRLTASLGKDVLLVDRFDRPGGGTRALMVSALTILGLDEFTGARTPATWTWPIRSGAASPTRPRRSRSCFAGWCSTSVCQTPTTTPATIPPSGVTIQVPCGVAG